MNIMSISTFAMKFTYFMIVEIYMQIFKLHLHNGTCFNFYLTMATYEGLLNEKSTSRLI